MFKTVRKIRVSKSFDFNSRVDNVYGVVTVWTFFEDACFLKYSFHLTCKQIEVFIINF